MRTPRRERTGVMLCYPLDEKRLAKWPKPFFIQPKLDGIRATWNPETNKLLSSTGKEIVSVPHIELQLREMNLKVKLDGELYIHDLPFQQAMSIIRREKYCHPEYKKVTFQFFDIVDFNETQRVRINMMRALLQSENVLRLQTVLCLPDDLMKYLDLFIGQGYEGIICRNPGAKYYPKRSTDIMKYKPNKTDHYLIVGLTEEVSIDGFLKTSLGAFVCEKDGQQFRVGTGPALTRDKRKWLWDNQSQVIGKILEVKYQYLTDRKIPRGPAVAMRVI